MRKTLKRLFKRRDDGMHVARYMEFLDKNPETNFQMDFFRGNIVDLQIFRQKVLVNRADFEIKIQDPEGFALELVFTMMDVKSKNAFDSFKNSEYFSKSEQSYISEDKNHFRYLILIERNHLNLFNYIKSIIEDIYRYDKDVKYSLNFHKLN